MAPIHHVHIDLIAQIIDELDPPERSRKLSNWCAVEEIVYMLQSGVSWRNLRTRTDCSPWTVYQRFRVWVRKGVFQAVWTRLLHRYAQEKLACDPRWFHDLFIDTSMVKNVSGEDCLGKNPTDRGRLATKHSAICDRAGVPVSSVFFAANRPDCTTTLESVDSIACPTTRDRRYANVLVGDVRRAGHLPGQARQGLHFEKHTVNAVEVQENQATDPTKTECT